MAKSDFDGYFRNPFAKLSFIKTLLGVLVVGSLFSWKLGEWVIWPFIVAATLFFGGQFLTYHQETHPTSQAAKWFVRITLVGFVAAFIGIVILLIAHSLYTL